MDNTSDYESDNEILELHLQNYAYLLADAATAVNVQTPRLSDLNPGHSRYLGNRPSSAQVLQRACLVDGHRISLYSVTVKGGVQEPWRLFVRDPMVAVECLRWDFGSTMQIAKAFLSRGTPFYTAAETQVGQPVNDYFFRGLGLRNAEYEPDLADYIAYEAEVLQFVQSPRGRAVLKPAACTGESVFSCCSPPIFPLKASLIFFPARRMTLDSPLCLLRTYTMT